MSARAAKADAAEAKATPRRSKGKRPGKAKPTRGARLRVAHVWRDEVMADQVFPAPTKVTLGTSKGSTFVVPDVGIPNGFAILRPGKRGYVLTVGSDMGGRLRLGGDEMEVADLIRKERGDKAAASAGDFHATPLEPGDWGVIELDGEGDHTLFFQFVADDGPLPPSRTFRDSELLLPAAAFAFILHTVILAIMFTLPEPGNPFVFPGRRELMARYLIRRPPVPEPSKAEAQTSEGADKETVNSASKGKKGKAGGEGKQPIARMPDGKEINPEAPKVALLEESARSNFNKIISHKAMDDKITRMLNRMGPRTPGSFSSGPGSGTGFGAGRDGTGTTRGAERGGTGGGGAADKLFESQGKIDAGKTRARKVKGNGGKRKEVAVVGTGTARGDFASWSKEEINKVVRSRQGFIRACYQSGVSVMPNLSGKVVVQFRIKGTGQVSSARVVGGKSTLRNSKVESCIVRQINRLKFPPKGGASAVVEVPFNFSQR